MTNSQPELCITEPLPDFITFHTLKNNTLDCTLSKELERMEVHGQGEADMIQVALQASTWAEQTAAGAEQHREGHHPVCPQVSEGSAASLPTASNNRFRREGKGYPSTHTLGTSVMAGEESSSRQGNNFSLQLRNWVIPEILHTFLGQLCCLLWYKHSPAVLLLRVFCNTSSASSLGEPSKHLPAVLFLCKAQKHLHKLLGFNCFCNGHILPDNLIYFEDHLWKLSHKPLSPVHTELPVAQSMSTAQVGCQPA